MINISSMLFNSCYSPNVICPYVKIDIDNCKRVKFFFLLNFICCVELTLYFYLEYYCLYLMEINN